MPSYNLVNEKWIPVVWADNTKNAAGLWEVLKAAHKIKEIFDQSPLVTLAIHRLLLAIMHRVFGPENDEAWRRLWQNGEGLLDENMLRNYFQEWQEVKQRFDLFHYEYPFYQCSTLPLSSYDEKGNLRTYTKSAANLIHEMATGNNATLFDHTVEDNPPAISPAEAARLLVTFQAFAVGGLLTFEAGQNPKFYKSADNAPLVKGALTLVRGNNLFQTLMLNFHKYNLKDAMPLEMDPSDAPAWERAKGDLPLERYPLGYLDLLTWQSRRIRLIPEENSQGVTNIRQVVVMKGTQFPEGFSLHNKETMLAFKKVAKASRGQTPYLPIAFREERALWRDSLALFQSIPETRTRPKILEWLYDLVFNDIIDRSDTYDLSVIGLVTDRALISLWRHERLPLPLRYLEDEDLVAALEDAIGIAEKTGSVLNGAAWNIARQVIAPKATTVNEQQKKDISDLARHLAITRPYWSELGTAFNELLLKLPLDRAEDNIRGIRYGENVSVWWAAQVRQSATNAFLGVSLGMDRTNRTLKAVTLAELIFFRKLKRELAIYLNNYNEEVKNE